MSSKISFTKENLDRCLRELGKEFRRLNGTAMPAEITLIGGASVLANYRFHNRVLKTNGYLMSNFGKNVCDGFLSAYQHAW